MSEKIRLFVEKHKDTLMYLLFGGLTTAVNFLVYTPLHKLVGLSAALSSGIAWAVAVAFAFLTNKPFVFQSHDWSAATVSAELVKFVGCRLASGATETILLALTVDYLGWDGMIMKVIAAIIVVVLNYIGSKLLVFRKQK